VFHVFIKLSWVPHVRIFFESLIYISNSQAKRFTTFAKTLDFCYAQICNGSW
jgi:hypothetical protein